MSLNTEEDKDNGFEFNDLETDERINIDIFQFDMAFPDPLYFCIGFITKEGEEEEKAKLVGSKKAAYSNKNDSDVNLLDYKKNLIISGSPTVK